MVINKNINIKSKDNEAFKKIKNMDITRKILLAIGISILISLIVGFLNSETKYFLLWPDQPKRDITKAYFEQYPNTLTTKEKVFNFQSAIISGLATFGFFTIIISFTNKKESKIE